ncbi:MAG: GNAT family N-acyltransferase [Bdellovibrionota bacterium]|nr:GNAT family N-acyltransferase [Bdellovibrionota bacterium]
MMQGLIGLGGSLIKNPFQSFEEKYEVFKCFSANSPYINIFFETENYLMKTADTLEEFYEIFSFRHSVFVKECHAESEYENIEIDHFDSICDHLVIKDKKSEKIIGYYRMISSAFSNEFYSENEFNLIDLKGMKENLLELGRACIDIHHRNGQVINLLWKGIGQYSLMTDTRYLFGCTSIHSESFSLAHEMYHYLKQENKVIDNFNITPTSLYSININFDNGPCITDTTRLKSEIPSLLKSYLGAGAKIASTPAYDKDFSCIDFFTIMDIYNVSRSFKRRYFSL